MCYLLNNVYSIKIMFTLISILHSTSFTSNASRYTYVILSLNYQFLYTRENHKIVRNFDLKKPRIIIYYKLGGTEIWYQ